MDLRMISLEIAKEKACIDDLLEMIGMHTQDGRLDLAMARTIDLIRSIERIQKLENQRRFYLTIHDLSNLGILCEVVKRCESLNGAS